MPLARDWAKERRAVDAPMLGRMDSPQPWQLDGKPARRRGSEPVGDPGDRIMRLVAAGQGGDEPGLAGALRTVAGGVGGRRVTFRRAATVPMWVCGKDEDARETFGDLPTIDVPAGARGETLAMVMVDGRDLVRLEDGVTVLARVGRECRTLRWWHRLVDRLRGRRF